TSTYSRSQLSGSFTALELSQEAQVVRPQVADVRKAVAKDGDPLEAPPEGEAGHLLGVVADEPEHVRVDHPGAADLDPPRVPAHRTAGTLAEEARHERLERRLGEREVVRDELRLALLAEQLPQQMQERALEVGERDPAVDREALHLVEHRVVRRVRRVAAVAAAERDHEDGRLTR